MKIEDKRNKDVPVCDVGIGKVFRLGKRFYLKTDRLGKRLDTYLCVELSEGTAVDMDYMAIVEIRPKAKVVIE